MTSKFVLAAGLAVVAALLIACGDSGSAVPQPGETPAPVARVAVTPEPGTLLAGRTLQLRGYPISAGGDTLRGRSLTWRRGNPAIATVTGDGLVTTVGEGTASVFAKSGDAELGAVPADAWRSAQPPELLVYPAAPSRGSPAGAGRHHVLAPRVRRAEQEQLSRGAARHPEGAGRRRLGDVRGRTLPHQSGRGVAFDALQFERCITAFTASLTRRARGRPARLPGTGAGHGAAGGTPLDETALQELQDALDRYRGDLLADEAAADWHLEYRDALRGPYSGTLHLAVDTCTRAGDHERAAEISRRLVLVGPLDEAGYRGLMQPLAPGGARTEAQYELAALLESELDARPARDTTAVRDRLARGEVVSAR
jgi:hypothetical protein